MAQSILSDATFTDYGSARSMYSAYQIFYQHKGDCDSMAHAMQIVFDMNGFKTRLGYTTHHAWLEVQVSGKWYSFEGSFNDI
ncbi:transglutaminase domain-containing protein [Viridibacillus sp. YIM B01967]|uniref:Transglutaminase domain-containing protein n=1 Tax=Viridibacillus soli TaxID=2798301 RepID=A0ABS1HA82_9BACL|nr:transglutaminase domain-containing protein [Viridibacillus soli]MBK3496343.1 transglutaminase domain-containing protein [Viridibacillus soli]